MHFKRLIVTITCISICSCIFADGKHKPQAVLNHGKWYAGAALGATNFWNKASTNSTSHSESTVGAIGGLFVGYQYDFSNRLDLGGEIFGNLTSANTADNRFNPKYKSKLRYNYGIRLLPGYQLNNKLNLHASIGYVRASIKNQQGVYSNTTNPVGYQLGLGASYNLYEHLIIRGDILYSNYANKSFNLGSSKFKSNTNELDGVLSLAVLYE